MSPAIHAPSARAGLVDLVGLLFTVLALVVAYKLTRPPPVIPVTNLPAATCNLQREACRLALPGGRTLELHIVGRPIRPNQPFIVEVRSDDGALQPLDMALRGIEIEMASPAKAFQPDGQGNYRVETALPICTVSRMTWEASVQIEAGGERLRWPLFFVTEAG